MSGSGSRSFGSTSFGHEGAVHDAKSNALHAMATKIAGHFPTVKLISCTQLQRKLEDSLPGSSIVLVDVRGPEETAVSMLPGALTAAEFEARKAELQQQMPKPTVVAYCTVGYRSSAYACKLQKEGWEARNLEGGCVRWAQKRFPLVARDAASGAVQPVKRVHVYGKSWALAPDDYEAVVFPNTFVATLRGLLPSWLGGHKK